MQKRACLNTLYNRERSHFHLRKLEKSTSAAKHEQDIYPLVLSELVTYIVETSIHSEGPTTFRLADMSHLYQQRLKQQGIDSPTTNSLNSRMTYMLYLKNRNGYRHVLGTKISAIPNFIFNFNICMGLKINAFRVIKEKHILVGRHLGF